MQTHSARAARRFSVYASLLLICALCIAACNTGGAAPATVSGSAPAPGREVATATPQIRLGVQSCPGQVKNPDYWDAIIGTQSGVSRVTHVECANLIGQPALQALILASYQGVAQVADVYIYNDITSSSPLQLFKLLGLLKGDARVSGYNTLITAEVDQASSLNKGRSNASMTPDLFREFKWSDGAGTFVPVTFPGIFPDLTRYQAEQDQASVTAGQDSWKYDTAQIARSLAVKLLKWSNNAQTTVLSGGGPRDVNAVVQVRSTGPDHPTIKVTLSRLEGNTANIWEAIAVTDGSVMSITSPQKWGVLTNPVTVKGTGSAFEGDVGTVYVLDHLSTAIGYAKGVPAHNGKTTFTATVPYSASFHGTQEGVLAYYTYSQANGAISGVIMLKVLISA
jgi:hypothetical protein